MNNKKQDYLNGMSILALSKKYKTSPYYIKLDLRNNDVKIRENDWKFKKYKKLNENYFSSIDSEDKAYFLGFIFADGYNQEDRNTLSIGLSSKDKIVLENFNKAICSDRKILEYKNPSRVILSITNQKMSNDLKNAGAIQNKSLVLKFPNVVPKNLLHHFIRGYFDGDGSISINKIGQLNVNIVGTQSFLLKINETLKKFGVIAGNKIYPQKNQKISYFRASGNKQCRRFYDYIYNQATIFLLRKKDIFESVIKL